MSQESDGRILRPVGSNKQREEQLEGKVGVCVGVRIELRVFIWTDELLCPSVVCLVQKIQHVTDEISEVTVMEDVYGKFVFSKGGGASY